MRGRDEDEGKHEDDARKSHGHATFYQARSTDSPKMEASGVPKLPPPLGLQAPASIQPPDARGIFEFVSRNPPYQFRACPSRAVIAFGARVVGKLR